MIKLYILSIIFCLGCSYLASTHIPYIADKLNVKVNETKENNLKYLKLVVITSIIPIFNIIIGISFLLFFMGKVDDEIVEKLNKS